MEYDMDVEQGDVRRKCERQHLDDRVIDSVADLIERHLKGTG